MAGMGTRRKSSRPRRDRDAHLPRPRRDRDVDFTSRDQPFIHVYSCSSLLCTFCFCRVYVSGISSCPVHPVFFSLKKSVQFSSVQTRR